MAIAGASVRNAAATRARILQAAQAAFSEQGYAQAGVRDVASAAGVASSLVIKYFGSKANLFREALADVFADVDYRASDKRDFADRLVEALDDPARRLVAPAMMALSLGDAEARAIVEEVLRDEVLAPVSEWLGAPDGPARAASLLVLAMGYALFGRRLRAGLSPGEHERLREILRRQIGAILNDD